jgi:flagellar assembly factor FliW
MKIPDFPRFTEIDMSLMSDVKRFLKVGCLDASEYTFTNIFAFRSAYDFRLSVLEKNLIIISKEKPVSMFCPVGRNGVSCTKYLTT